VIENPLANGEWNINITAFITCRFERAEGVGVTDLLTIGAILQICILTKCVHSIFSTKGKKTFTSKSKEQRHHATKNSIQLKQTLKETPPKSHGKCIGLVKGTAVPNLTSVPDHDPQRPEVTRKAAADNDPSIAKRKRDTVNEE
jgi:hypothetical protein